jgi:hypothetical protein
MVPPTNQTKLEGEKVQFSCEAKALPGNVTVRWWREGTPVKQVPSLETRVTVRRDGSLVINPVAAEDTGQYTCQVSNGIGDPQSASAYLSVECKIYFYITNYFILNRLQLIFSQKTSKFNYLNWDHTNIINCITQTVFSSVRIS